MTVSDPKHKSNNEHERAEETSLIASFEAFFDTMNKWLKLIGPSLIVVTVIYATFSYIDNAVDKKFQDPEFINEVVQKTTIPFAIFNENEQILYSSPQKFYDDYINAITVKKGDKGSIQEIIFSPKKFLNLPPILVCLDGFIEFYDAQRVNKADWVYKAKKMKHLYLLSTENEGELSVKRFKISVIQ